MGLLKEFKDFALRGNVMDMAVGTIIGGAFQKIVTSVINDILMGPIGAMMSIGGAPKSFKDQFTPLGTVPKNLVGKSLDVFQKEGFPVFAYGAFMQTVIDFLILAVCVFVMVKLINTARTRFETKKIEEPPPPAPDIKLLTEIRDLLAKR